MIVSISEMSFEINRRESPTNNIMALVTISYHGLRIKGFRILSKTDRKTGEIVYWVGPPQYYNKLRKKYCMLFYMDKFIWKQVEKRILAQYMAEK